MHRPAVLWFMIFLGVVSCTGGDDPSTVVVGVKPDPWVSAAPMIVAAVCQDGIALLALHTESSHEEHNTTDHAATMNSGTTTKTTTTKTTTTTTTTWMDSYRGPARIAQIDAVGTALLCAGWRPDADWLATKCRSMAAMEARTFHTLEPQDVSLWMAHCASSNNNVRALSVVGLLCRTTHKNKKEIWLLDVTGAHGMRAVAVGRGAKIMNERLCKIDFSSMTAMEGVDRLCQLLVEKGDEEGWDPISNTTHVELAVLNDKQKRLHRIRQPFLVTNKLSTG